MKTKRVVLFADALELELIIENIKTKKPVAVETPAVGIIVVGKYHPKENVYHTLIAPLGIGIPNMNFGFLLMDQKTR